MLASTKVLFADIFKCILLITCVTASPVAYRQITERYNSIAPKDYSTLSCMCPNESIIEKKIERVTRSEILNGSPSCSVIGGICDLLHSCRGCTVYSEICLPSVDKKIFECVRDTYMLNDNFFMFNTIKNSSLERNRLKRNPLNFPGIERGDYYGKVNIKTCKYPSNLKTSELLCEISFGKVICSQTCILGYTLPNGRRMDYECKRKENKWLPSNFKECEPYVDCTISLTSKGSADCYTPTSTRLAMCYLSCDQYEDRSPVPRRAYTCNEKGEWKRKLPFCARAGSNLALVAPPH